jgi:hypothetical protein
MAFASGIQARLPLDPLTRGFLTTLQASLHAADRSVARPAAGRSSSASTPGSHPTPGVLLPGTLASPRTGLTPAGCRELGARLHPRSSFRHSGARATGRTFRRNLQWPCAVHLATGGAAGAKTQSLPGHRSRAVPKVVRHQPGGVKRAGGEHKGSARHHALHRPRWRRSRLPRQRGPGHITPSVQSATIVRRNEA